MTVFLGAFNVLFLRIVQTRVKHHTLFTHLFTDGDTGEVIHNCSKKMHSQHALHASEEQCVVTSKGVHNTAAQLVSRHTFYLKLPWLKLHSRGHPRDVQYIPVFAFNTELHQVERGRTMLV